MTLEERIRTPGPKKILSLDGGGILGMISVEILAGIEDMLRKQLQRGADFVLADYFDLAAGTTPGALIAACVVAGMPVARIREFYETSGKDMFDPAFVLKRLYYKYHAENVTRNRQG